MNLHIVDKMNNFVKINDIVWESGWWELDERCAKELVGGEIFFHKTRQEPSFYGGTVLGYRIVADGPYRGKIIFTLRYNHACRNVRTDKSGWQKKFKIIGTEQQDEEGMIEMAEDLLDHWVKLLTPIFPSNAWIVSEVSKDDFIIQIDWKMGSEGKRRDKRSRKIRIVIKEDVIGDYLDKNQQDRKLNNLTLWQSTYERYILFHAENDPDANHSAPSETWLVTKEYLNTFKTQNNREND